MLFNITNMNGYNRGYIFLTAILLHTHLLSMSPGGPTEECFIQAMEKTRLQLLVPKFILFLIEFTKIIFFTLDFA